MTLNWWFIYCRHCAKQTVCSLKSHDLRKLVETLFSLLLVSDLVFLYFKFCSYLLLVWINQISQGFFYYSENVFCHQTIYCMYFVTKLFIYYIYTPLISQKCEANTISRSILLANHFYQCIYKKAASRWPWPIL